MHTFKGEDVSKDTLAREACDIEINRLGAQIGIQDQYAVSYGGFNRYYYHKDDTVTVKKLNFSSKLLEKFMLFYTGNPRDSRPIFKEQEKNTKSKKEILDSLIEISDKANACLEKEEFDKIGLLLDQAWQIKKQFASSITNSNIDNMYTLALNSGALGGKVLGAGGGGFLLLYVPIDKQDAVRKALMHYKEIPFQIEEKGSIIVYKD